jgi:predicted RNA-binding protein with PIN domain
MLATFQMSSSKDKTLLLVDGYNVLRSGIAYSHISTPDYTHDVPNCAREALLNDVVLFAGNNLEPWIIYDGAGNASSNGTPRSRAGAQVVFSPTGISADSVIEQMARNAAHAGRDALVITSDAETQWAVLGKQVTRMSADGFCNEVAALKRELGVNTQKGVTAKAHDDMPTTYTTNKNIKRTLADRIDKGTLAKLKALQR